MPFGLEVLEVNDLRLSSALPAWNAGERLQLTNLKIDSGEVDVKLDSGVTLSLEGPFHAEFENSGSMQLFHGKMSAEVDEKGKGFTVRTATSEVVDLGTRFGISAKADGETDVVVFEGEVKVRRKNNPTQTRKMDHP
jgi:ferric-dicitrate binding protein FerR (iron transport regulator)